LKNVSRRALIALGLIETCVAGVAGLVVGCSPPVVRRAAATPITSDPRGAILVVIDAGRARYGPVWVGAVGRGLLGACVAMTHFVVLVPPGRSLLVAHDDDSYDAAEADLAPGAIYSIEVNHNESELEIVPLVPGRDSIRRLLDETDRVELARTPRGGDLEEHERKARLAHRRYEVDYSAAKRAKRAIGPSHAWR
jgi:hypothetical protein